MLNIKSTSNFREFQRLEDLKTKFTEEFLENSPSHVIRVPGRVNLIGEHIDYCGYAVLPMAIAPDVLVAIGKDSQSSYLKLRNMNNSRFADFSMNLSEKWDIEAGAPHWYKYFLCGMKGIMDEFPDYSCSTGLNVIIDGRIPPSAGLSSSSAVVVAAALCTIIAYDVPLKDTQLLARICAQSERYVGTQGGGMDQAIEILAEEGKAKLIEFNPLRTYDVSLPEGANFVIINSLAESNKAAGEEFNTRVLECQLACRILSSALGIPCPKNNRLGDLQKSCFVSLADMVGECQKHLKVEDYTLQELSAMEETRDLLSKQTSATKFSLLKRAKHVYAEAQRVYDFKKLSDDGDGSSSLKPIGELMSQSHKSCRDLYECSHPDIDILVDLAMKNDAYGARLTGAGWGGCIVALVPKDKVSSFKNNIIEEYFIGKKAMTDVRDFEPYIFDTSPGNGAYIMEFP